VGAAELRGAAAAGRPVVASQLTFAGVRHREDGV
jgi:hypothetical protein